MRVLGTSSLNPWQSLVLSFGVLIVSGTLMFFLPGVRHDSGLELIDALFTATSAVCVTGLTSIPTSGFNTPGQWLILVLMQTGAIGIMTLTSSFLLALRGTIRLRHRAAISELQDDFTSSGTHEVLKNIIKITLMVEWVGFVLLSAGFYMEGFPLSTAMYHGLFHSVSAFCNAGFSTFDSSLTGMNAMIKYVVMILIFLGGSGYFVLYEWWEILRKRRKKTGFHARIVWLVSMILIIAGAVLIFTGEKGNISFTDSLFQSVTARTAGFNTVDISNLRYASLFVLIVLMFVGASPGSTGGGIKTTSFFAMIYSVWGILRGKEQVVIYHRTIPNTFIIKSFAVAVLYFITISLGILFLLETQDFALEEVMFEVVSAMGTVGLSMGITPQLDVAGKLMVVMLMFIGRVGPASMALAMMKRNKNVKIHYPVGDLY